MSDNKVKELRLKRGLTQAQLATACETSQQQIQRIESGVQTARLELASAIAKALGATLPSVFPGTKKVVRKVTKSEDAYASAIFDEGVEDEFAEGGVDFDPRQWTLRYNLVGGHKGNFPISSKEKRRLWQCFNSSVDDDAGFVWFSSTDQSVAINPRTVQFVQFLFDPPNLIAKTVSEQSSIEDDEKGSGLCVHFVNSPDVETFSIEPDQADMSEIFDGGADDRDVELQSFFMELEGSDASGVVRFTDVDGETVVLPVRNVAMVTAPLAYVEPRLFEAEMDGLDEEEPLPTKDK